MTPRLLERVLLPVSNEHDADVTGEAVCEHLDVETTIHAIHVIEKGGGAPNKAPLGARQEVARAAFDRLENRLGKYDLETELRYGTDVIDEILAAAEESPSTAIAFVPRESGPLTRLLTGDKTRELVAGNRFPVIVLPRPTARS